MIIQPLLIMIIHPLSNIVDRHSLLTSLIVTAWGTAEELDSQWRINTSRSCRAVARFGIHSRGVSARCASCWRSLRVAPNEAGPFRPQQCRMGGRSPLLWTKGAACFIWRCTALGAAAAKATQPTVWKELRSAELVGVSREIPDSYPLWTIVTVLPTKPKRWNNHSEP